MPIFKRWRKQEEPPQQLRRASPAIEPERPKSLLEVGWDVAEAMSLNSEDSMALYNSLGRDEEKILLSHGSLFVSKKEFDYFLECMRSFKQRPVVVFDFENLQNPIDNLIQAVEEYRDKPRVPIIFVKNYFQDLADRLDPRSDFDLLLRSQVQHSGWAAIIYGNRHAHKTCCEINPQFSQQDRENEVE